MIFHDPCDSPPSLLSFARKRHWIERYRGRAKRNMQGHSCGYTVGVEAVPKAVESISSDLVGRRGMIILVAYRDGLE